MAPVIKELAERADVTRLVCVTAQHRQMLDQALSLFKIQPDFDLNIMQKGQTPTQVASTVLEQLEGFLQKERPDWILVQGDTTTAMAAAIAAFYARIRIGHIEAGLRTYDKWQPFPEEINRRIVSTVSDLHFAPTEWARQNLLKEGIEDGSIRVTGNTVIDALQYIRLLPQPQGITDLVAGLSISTREQPSISVKEAHLTKRLILVTAHRRENFGQPMEEICSALRELASRGDVEIVYPVHLNPNVQEPVYRLLKGVAHITLLPPFDYLPLVHLMKHAYLILTDSGGIQEEATAFGIPVLVLRDVTERPEGIAAGTLKLVGTRQESILSQARLLLDDLQAYHSMAKVASPYGDGQAAKRIVDEILKDEWY